MERSTCLKHVIDFLEEKSFISKKFTTLKMACPEAARLCLSSKESMNI